MDSSPSRDVASDTGGSALVAYGWTDDVARRYPPDARGVPARVARVDGPSCIVCTPRGTERAALARGIAPVTGDWVLLSGPPGSHIVQLIADRTTVLTRLDPNEVTRQVLAANVDRVFVVHGLDRPVRRSRIERTVAMAWESGAVPHLVLNKVDLVDVGPLPLDGAGAEAVMRRAAPGVDVVAVSASTGEGVGELATRLEPGETVVMVGESGAGKSSLVNALVARHVTATGPTRRGDGKGRHTTSVRELIPLQNGAVLMDTPGLRAVALVDGVDGVARTFPEVRDLASGCRFRDCAHDTEPGCAVLAAVNTGEVDPARLVAYRKLQRELAFQQRRMEQRRRRSGPPVRKGRTRSADRSLEE